jgi:hypothetical protein
MCKSRFTTSINDTGGKFSTNTASVVDTGGKFEPAANNGNTIRLLTLLLKGVPKKVNNFLIEDFCICHRCQQHRWCTLKVHKNENISANFRKNFGLGGTGFIKS